MGCRDDRDSRLRMSAQRPTRCGTFVIKKGIQGQFGHLDDSEMKTTRPRFAARGVREQVQISKCVKRATRDEWGTRGPCQSRESGVGPTIFWEHVSSSHMRRTCLSVLSSSIGETEPRGRWRGEPFSERNLSLSFGRKGKFSHAFLPFPCFVWINTTE